MEQPKDSLRSWLREWARWHQGSQRSGYTAETTLYRAQFGGRDTPPGPRIPDGVRPPEYLEPLMHAMRELLADQRTAYPVSVMRDFYLSGGAEKLMQARKMGRRQAFELRSTGEAMLRAWLCARGY